MPEAPRTLETDVLVVGFGVAGATAALRAREAGATVMVIDRFGGGGATKKSGGIVYAGGGTPAQAHAGFDDTPAQMSAYLRAELGPGLDEAALSAFCDESVARMRWLEAQGVVFDLDYYAEKTTQPPAGYGLYVSGNEVQRGAGIPRGHRVRGGQMSGHDLYEALAAKALAAGVTVRRHHAVLHLLRDGRGRVVGARVRALVGAVAQAMHAALEATASGLGTARASGAALARAALERFERTAGREVEIRARRGVVLATGGFAFSPELLASHAPQYAGCMPIGSAGDDGVALRLGAEVDASTAHLDRCAASRFFAPPSALLGGVLIDRDGARFCDESLYGATLSAAMAAHDRGPYHLIIDQALYARALDEVEAFPKPWAHSPTAVARGEANDLLFRHYVARQNLGQNAVHGEDLTPLARTLRVSPRTLCDTVARYNEDQVVRERDAFGKPDAHRALLGPGPFLAIRCDLDSRAFPAPFLTLGGLSVDTSTAAVITRAGRAVPGLYAAGRAAAGVASSAYVSGLSLADGIFTGMAAGSAAARAIVPDDPTRMHAVGGADADADAASSAAAAAPASR